MTTHYIGEIRLFAGDYAPRGWMFCEGQLVPIPGADTLYHYLGNTFGGSIGDDTFALPDLRGRVPIHTGAGHALGAQGGAESVVLQAAHLPAHGHPVHASAQPANTRQPGAAAWAASDALRPYAKAVTGTLHEGAVAATGGGAAHGNMQPWLAVSFLIALEGLSPDSTPGDALTGEVRLLPYDKVPPDWLRCDGQMLDVRQHGPLQSVLGATFGGDGTSTMALPNLQGRAALHADGAHPRGWHGGEAAHTLTVPEMPGHAHTPMGSSAAAASPQPSGRTWGIPEKIAAYTDAKPDQAMAADALAATGDGAAHDNMQPWLALNHCICADGVPDSGLNPFVAEIRLYAGATPPKGWALCDGQVLPIQGNTALHSLLGNRFGGDGVKTFALPDLRGRVPLHHGQGPGLTDRLLGQQGGETATYLKSDELPAHTHAAQCAGVAGSASPAGQVWAAAAGPTPEGTLLYANVPDTPMSTALVGATGGGQPHNNMQPSLALNFIIALQGTFPPRS